MQLGLNHEEPPNVKIQFILRSVDTNGHIGDSIIYPPENQIDMALQITAQNMRVAHLFGVQQGEQAHLSQAVMALLLIANHIEIGNIYIYNDRHREMMPVKELTCPREGVCLFAIPRVREDFSMTKRT